MSLSIDHIISIVDNNRPQPRSCVKFPYGICNKTVKQIIKQYNVTCDLWVHIGSNGVSDTKYEHLKTDLNPWFCLVCCLKYNLDNAPFTRCDNSELININNSNSMRFLESLPTVEIVNEATKFSFMSSNDASIELASKSCSKYYSDNDFQLLNISNNFNISHTNINGLESKLDILNEFSSGTPYKLDVLLALPDTSEKEDTGFFSNVALDDFQKFHTASNSSKGGTAIYANKNFDMIEKSRS